MDCIPLIPLKGLEQPGLGSSLNDVSPKQNFGNQFWTRQSVMMLWP